MSQEKVNPRLIKSNIDLLTKIVKRPAVTEKILSRPPFRFLFDLTTMIIKTTGYLRGLYTEEEFNFENVNANKESKMAFLDKLIDVIGFINSKTIDVKSAKIVAGLEVEKTNKLLNEFAKSVLDKKPFLECVEKVRRGSKPVVSNKSNTIKATVSDNNEKKNNANQTKSIHRQSGQQQKTETAGKSKQSVQTAKVTTPLKVLNVISFSEKRKEAEQIVQKESIVKNVFPNNVDKPMKKQSDQFVDGNVLNVNENMQNIIHNNSVNNNDNTRRPTTTKSELHQDDKMQEQIFSYSTTTTTNYNDEIKLFTDSTNDQENCAHLSSLENEISNEKTKYSIINENLPATNEIEDNEEEGEEREKRKIHDVMDSTHKRTQHNELISEGKPESISIIDQESIGNIPPNTQNISDETQEKILFGDDQELIGKVLSESEDLTSHKTIVPSPNVRESLGKNIIEPITSSGFSPSESTDIVSSSLKSSKMKSARPKSSRPAPPRVMTASRSRLSQLMENSTEQLGDNVMNGVSNVWIPETIDDESDEFLISPQKLQDSFLTMSSDQSNVQELGIYSKGHLVQQLLATKNELEGQIKESNSIGDQIMEEQVNETNQLRNQIQAICQSIGTLTKAMGYLHEDVGPMLDELKKWQDEFESNSKTINKIRSEMNNDLEPFNKELEQIERQIDDYKEQIRVTKANVFRNEQIISKLIDSV